MRLVVISDAHAQGPGDPSQDSLVTWLDRLEADELVLLGDIFHHWWGFPGRLMEPYRPLCAALLRLRSRGISLRVVPGNHDFALGPFFHEELRAQVSEGPLSLVVDGRRLLLAHGDEADGSRGYRMTRALLRGRPFAALMAALGPERGWTLLARLAGSSRAHGGDPEPLVRAQQAWALPRLGAEADVVVMGHIHVPRLVPTERGLIVHLGDWVEHRTWLRIDDGAAPALLCGLEGLPFAG